MAIMSNAADGRAVRRAHARVAARAVPVAIALLLAACGAPSVDVRDATGRVVAAGDWSVFDLRPGDCIGDLSGMSGDTSDVPLVPCEQPHGMEVYELVMHPDEEYPGTAAIASYADSACLQALEDRLGLGIDDGIAFSYFLPTATGWTDDGDRVSICVLVLDPDAGVTGSFVEGTADVGAALAPGAAVSP